jgi:hypothetical protein
MGSWQKLFDWVQTIRIENNYTICQFLYVYDIKITCTHVEFLLYNNYVPSNKPGTIGRQFRDDLVNAKQNGPKNIPKQPTLHQQVLETYLENEGMLNELGIWAIIVINNQVEVYMGSYKPLIELTVRSIFPFISEDYEFVIK